MRIPLISTLIYACNSVFMRIPLISTLIYACRFRYRGLEIRNSANPNPSLYNINFHVFFDYTTGKIYFLSPRTTKLCTNEASTESLWIVDSRNRIFRLAQIQVSATRALKFDRTPGSKQHNIKFHVFFDYAPGISCFLFSWTLY